MHKICITWYKKGYFGFCLKICTSLFSKICFPHKLAHTYFALQTSRFCTKNTKDLIDTYVSSISVFFIFGKEKLLLYTGCSLNIVFFFVNVELF